MTDVLKVCACRNCDKPIENKRKKYCSSRCKWLENSFVRDETKHLPPKYKRTQGYFYMSTGKTSGIPRGAGRRMNGMVKGSMAAAVSIEIQQIAPVTPENLIRHFKVNNNYRQNMKFCDETSITKEEAVKRFSLTL